MPAIRPLSFSRARATTRTRLAALTIAAATGATGMVALSGPAAAAATTTLTPMASRVVNAGTTLLITGRLTSDGTPVTGRTVVYHWRANARDGWHAAGARATNSSGYASLPQRLGATRQYRMRFAGDATYAASPWVMTTVTVRSLGQRAVAEASRHRGAPYQYGASGPRQFDCSGFTLYVFSRLGRSLPHSAASQYAHTRHLAHNQMRAGDLVFFHSGSSIYHVGIYAGGGRIWAATHTGDYVRLEGIYSSSYYVGRVA